MAAKKKAARKAKVGRPSKPKPVREGSKRAKIIALMSRKGGATLAEIKRATKWDDKTAREGIRLVSSYSGYTVIQSDDKQSFRIGGAAAKPKAKRARKPAPAEASAAA